MPTYEKNYHACGAVYGWPQSPHFAFVSPSKGELPYVCSQERAIETLFGLCKHHSHLYRVSDDLTTAILVQEGEFFPMEHTAPQALKISATERERLEKADKTIFHYTG